MFFLAGNHKLFLSVKVLERGLMFHYLMEARINLPQKHERGTVTSQPALTLTWRFAFPATVTVPSTGRRDRQSDSSGYQTLPPSYRPHIVLIG